MRVFAVSDLHVDYEVNVLWIESISLTDYQGDVLLVAGDVSNSLLLLGRRLDALTRRS
jgi:Icc-related predicted phosphoesterase